MSNLPKRVIFFALHETFSWTQIGGTDSYMRRLSQALVEDGIQVEWVFYGQHEPVTYVANDIVTRSFELFRDAVSFLGKSRAVVFTCFIRPADRFKFALKRFLSNQFDSVYSLSFFYPDTLIKKLLRVIELKIGSYKGVACVSRRLLEFNARFHWKVFYLPPIVPDEYFSVGRKRIAQFDSGRTLSKLLFLGRLDPRKGINEVLEMVENGKLEGGYCWTISGIFIESDPGNVEALNRIKALKNIEFHEEERGAYDRSVEERVLGFMSNADWFLQPYKSLASTVDLPLLLLEAQAAGCIVLTTLPDRLSAYLSYPGRAFEDPFCDKAINYIKTVSDSALDGELLMKMVETVESSFSKTAVLKIFKENVANAN